MKGKIIPIAESLVFTICMFTGCSKYTPEATEHYFQDGEVYRVFALSDNEPEYIENYGLHSYMFPSADIGKVEVTTSESFSAKSLFFDEESIKAVNKEGIVALYEFLDITNYSILDEYYSCDFTGLYSYNQKTQFSKTTFTFDLGENPLFTVFGDVADVYKYTFEYEDRSIKDGSIKDKGSFSVYYNETEPHAGTFVIYQ